MKKITSIIIVALSFSLGVCAQDKVTTSTNMIGVGGTNILDTYLSAEKYRGTEIRYLSEMQWRKDGKNWSGIMINQGHVSLARNRADNGKDITGMYNFAYGRLRNFSFLDNTLRLQAGVIGDFNLGFIYNNRNGNNPAQARCYLNVAPMVTAEYDLSLWKKLFTIRYAAEIAALGVMFSPNYGQSYYEIFTQGNYDHNVVFTTIGSAPSFRQMLSVDIPLKKSFKLRVAYLGDYQQAKANNLKSHVFSNMFMIGITKQFKLIRM